MTVSVGPEQSKTILPNRLLLETRRIGCDSMHPTGCVLDYILLSSIDSVIYYNGAFDSSTGSFVIIRND
jgi:hypothetical protein